MTEHPIRFFEDDAAIAHLGATAYLVTHRPDIDLDTELPGMIRRFNESVGGVNDDSQGYHDTITKAYLAGVREAADQKQAVELAIKLFNRIKEASAE